MSSDTTNEEDAAEPGSGDHPDIGGPYARYVLFVLMLVYVFNFIDRNILSILAEDIKADLGLTDAQLGFLYGTVFAVFYAIFGIPLGRLADIWTRRKLIATGLFFWSGMTALSGTARSFLSLGAYRIGVGIGESSASPAAFSMLGDYFPPRVRATVLSIYSSGVYIGAGIGIFLGGWIVTGWDHFYPDGNAPFDLQGWQVAFFMVGLPGLAMAVWVWTLREPIRGLSEGIKTAQSHPTPFREFWKEFASVVPPMTLWSLHRAGAGTKGVGRNVLSALAIAAIAFGLIQIFGDPPQWIALGIGVYAFVSWVQGLALRDHPTYAMIFGSKALVFSIVGFSTLAFSGYALGFWIPTFFQRIHGISTAETGTVLGLSAAIGGWIGITSGGMISDRLKKATPTARIWVGVVTVLTNTPCVLGMLMTSNVYVAYACNFGNQMTASFWVGTVVAVANELVLPRMRATSSAFYILTVTFIGLALGPYTVGKISDAFVAGGTDDGSALKYALMISLLTFIVSIVCFVVAGRHIEEDENTRIERARAAGEPGL